MPPKRKTTATATQVRLLPIADLEPAPYNARTIAQRALEGLAKSMERFGVLALPVVNEVDGQPLRIVGGHQRIHVLREAGITETRCLVVRLSREDEQRACYALNNPHIEGAFVPDLTRELLAKIREAVPDTADALFDDLQLDAIVTALTRNAVAAEGDRTVSGGAIGDDAEPRYANTAAESQVGKMYKLGDHRILCARLHQPGALDERFGVKQATMAFTHVDPMVGDTDLAVGFLDTHLLQVLGNVEHAIYVATTMRRMPAVYSRFVELGGHVSNLLVAYAEGGSNGYYPDVTVPVVYGWRSGAARPFYGDRDRGNVRRLKDALVPGHLPVEVAVWGIVNSSRVGETVLDSHMQRGATLIAAQKTGRRLLGMGDTARRCDRIRQRWTRFAHGEGADWLSKTGEL